MSDQIRMQEQHDSEQRDKKLNTDDGGLKYNDDFYDTCSHLLIMLGYTVMLITFPVLFFLYLKVIN